MIKYDIREEQDQSVCIMERLKPAAITGETMYIGVVNKGRIEIEVYNCVEQSRQELLIDIVAIQSADTPNWIRTSLLFYDKERWDVSTSKDGRITGRFKLNSKLLRKAIIDR